MSDALKWLDENKDKIVLVPEYKLEELLELRDHWEGKAAELAGDEAKLLNVEIGDHSSGNCTVQNPIEAAYAKTNSDDNVIDKDIYMSKCFIYAIFTTVLSFMILFSIVTGKSHDSLFFGCMIMLALFLGEVVEQLKFSQKKGGEQS